ncbi:MAG: ribbon-helix-helix protein, CopG family [Rhizobacter sp.]|nr:ribbon-helix-helix protein, CopG family [Chlorobiales bacterium]
MRITVHLPDDIAQSIREAAELENESVSSLMAKAVKDYTAKAKRTYYGKLALKQASPENITADALDALHHSRKEHAKSHRI